MSNKIHNTKEFLSLEAQINLLKRRNLIIKNEDYAKRQLLEKNYFDLINGFETLMLKNSQGDKKEYEHFYFEDFIFLYNLDKKINIEILKLLDKLETRLKTSMAYRFCEKNFLTPADAKCYIDINKYTNPRSNHLSLPRDIAKPLYSHDLFKKYTKKSVDYVEFCKSKYAFLSTYDNPPFWMTIKILSFGSLFKLLLGYEKDIFKEVIKDMGMDYRNDKEKLINSIRIFIELRNTCAHFQLVNRFRTPKNLRIDNGLILSLGLRTKLNVNGSPTNYELRLYDTLLVLSQFENVTNIGKLIQQSYKTCNSKRQRILMKRLLGRMGREKLIDWLKLGY
ncbi:Abi family protein [Sporosarcina obsidiansis]|uniref:Abi family protein n=1 Tax=Sporosarcina obsidiansis TaxID=2660748 RepID=UPI00189168DE|nr:Abi family protein [Sporosarcina obsidiansis]